MYKNILKCNDIKLNPLSSGVARERIFWYGFTKIKSRFKCKKTGNKTEFNDLIIVYTGVAETQYFAKLKDENGNVVEGADGKPKKVDTVSGYTYTFNELGTAVLSYFVKTGISIIGSVAGWYI